MRYALLKLSLLSTMLLATISHAANMIDLREQPDLLASSPTPQTTPAPQSFSAFPKALGTTPIDTIQLKVIKKEVDAHGITHIRYQQIYQSVPVWGGEAIKHISKTNVVKSNGDIFQNIAADLPTKPANQQQLILAAENQAMKLYRNKTGDTQSPTQHKSQFMVYIDDHKKAHWAVQVDLYYVNNNAMPSNPIYLIDALTLDIYKEWSGNHYLDKVKAGGLGGNPLVGKVIYDGLANNKPAFDILRDSTMGICYFQNDYIIIKDGRSVTNNDPKTAKTMSFNCTQPNPTHGNIYWNEAFDQINGAWSPANDAMYYIDKVNQMYQEWYGIPVLQNPNNPAERMKISAQVHDTTINIFSIGSMNAGWNPRDNTLYFGDGLSLFGYESNKYPFVVPGVVAHELSHGFSSQHARLFSLGEPGGLNESFADMADATFEYYLTGKNTWMVAAGLNKDGTGLRYLDDPKKDGESLDNAQDYYTKRDNNIHVDVHNSSGIFNKLFYLLSQPKEKGGLGNPKIAFKLMLQANQYYWTSIYLYFNEAASGILDAAVDIDLDTNDILNIQKAMKQVGLDVSSWQAIAKSAIKNVFSPKSKPVIVITGYGAD